MRLRTHPVKTAPRPANIWAPAIVALGLFGCSSNNSLDWEQAYRAVRQSWDSSATKITLQQASAIPYATLGVRIGGNPEQLIVLAGNQQNALLWTSAAKIALETRDGRIVQSSGLPFNLGATVFRSGDPLTTITNTRSSADSSRTVDFPDQSRFSVALDCEMSVAGEQTITILGADISTFRVEERCQSKQLDWDFTNTFWVGQTSSFVWRSKQFIHPKLPAIETEVLRPPT